MPKSKTRKLLEFLRFYDGELLLLLIPAPTYWLLTKSGLTFTPAALSTLLMVYYLVVAGVIWATSHLHWR